MFVFFSFFLRICAFLVNSQHRIFLPFFKDFFLHFLNFWNICENDTFLMFPYYFCFPLIFCFFLKFLACWRFILAFSFRFCTFIQKSAFLRIFGCFFLHIFPPQRLTAQPQPFSCHTFWFSRYFWSLCKWWPQQLSFHPHHLAHTIVPPPARLPPCP